MLLPSGWGHNDRFGISLPNGKTYHGYLWKDGSGKVIYVGKAKNLRARMRQYVTLQDDRAKIPLMMQVVRSFDYIVVENEHQCLVLGESATPLKVFGVAFVLAGIAMTQIPELARMRKTPERNAPDEGLR